MKNFPYLLIVALVMCFAPTVEAQVKGEEQPKEKPAWIEQRTKPNNDKEEKKEMIDTGRKKKKKKAEKAKKKKKAKYKTKGKKIKKKLKKRKTTNKDKIPEAKATPRKYKEN